MHSTHPTRAPRGARTLARTERFSPRAYNTLAALPALHCHLQARGAGAALCRLEDCILHPGRACTRPQASSLHPAPVALPAARSLASLARFVSPISWPPGGQRHLLPIHASPLAVRASRRCQARVGPAGRAAAALCGWMAPCAQQGMRTHARARARSSLFARPARTASHWPGMPRDAHELRQCAEPTRPRT